MEPASLRGYTEKLKKPCSTHCPSFGIVLKFRSRNLVIYQPKLQLTKMARRAQREGKGISAH
jgi:hypothetical protein